MELPSFAIAGALMALNEKGVVARVEGGSRVAKFKHRLDEVLQASADEIAVLAELLLRGPQAPGALKPRVARFGYQAGPEAIEELLRSMAARKPALVEQLPLGPREQHRRWRHLIGDGSEAQPAAEAKVAAAAPLRSSEGLSPNDDDAPGVNVPSILRRLAALEAEVATLRAEFERRLP
jgi:uncharacterized protein